MEFLTDGAVRPSGYPAVTTPALIDRLLAIGNPLVWSSMMIRSDATRRLDPFTRPERLYALDSTSISASAPSARSAGPTGRCFSTASTATVRRSA